MIYAEKMNVKKMENNTILQISLEGVLILKLEQNEQVILDAHATNFLNLK